MEVLFWLLFSVIFYCYFGYPLIILGLAKIFGRPIQKAGQVLHVSVVISVYNEADVLERKISNLFSLDYPKDKIEILISSDGSTDRTNNILKGIKNEHFRFIENSQRRGKMANINRLLELARGEIVVFTDARQILAANAIWELVANFKDPKVGCVSGELFFSSKDGGMAKGINLYWNYEKFIRVQESRIHSMLGATGAIYAIRKELFTKIPENIILDDMFVPLQIIKKGYRAIVDGEAKAFDEVAESSAEEYQRKTRTLFGNYQIFGLFPELFIPLMSPIAFQIISHKLLRVLIPFFLIALFLINIALVRRPFFNKAILLQIIFYLMAMMGGLARDKNYGILKFVLKVCYVPYVFCLLNFSALVGFWKFLTRGQYVTWQKARKTR